MLDSHRKPGVIPIDAALRDALAELRARENATAPPALDIDRLRDVERAVGMRFPDDLLAVFAAHLPSLEDDLDWRLATVVGHTGALREHGALGNLVGLGCLESHLWYCVEIESGRDEQTRLRIYDADDQSLAAVRLSDWLAERLELAREAHPGEVSPQPFEPRLIERPLESTAAGRRVRHATFGEGRVLAEHGTGPTRKVKADFPGHGLKLLQARFLEFLDD